MFAKPNLSYTAFAGARKIASGEPRSLIPAIKKFLQKDPKAAILIFEDLTGCQTDFDLRGSVDTILERIEKQIPSCEKKVGPGRPKLGVIAKEVTLLPEHWDWLSTQPGGASVTLRRVVDSAMKKNSQKDQVRRAQERTYKVMTTMAGNLQGYEEALRSMYADEQAKFERLVKAWPSDIADYILKLSRP